MISEIGHNEVQGETTNQNFNGLLRCDIFMQVLAKRLVSYQSFMTLITAQGRQRVINREGKKLIQELQVTKKNLLPPAHSSPVSTETTSEEELRAWRFSRNPPDNVDRKCLDSSEEFCKKRRQAWGLKSSSDVDSSLKTTTSEFSSQSRRSWTKSLDACSQRCHACHSEKTLEEAQLVNNPFKNEKHYHVYHSADTSTMYDRSVLRCITNLTQQMAAQINPYTFNSSYSTRISRF